MTVSQVQQVKDVIESALSDGETIDRIGTYQAIHDALLKNNLLSRLAVENPEMVYSRIVLGVCADSPADDTAQDVLEYLAWSGMIEGQTHP